MKELLNLIEKSNNIVFFGGAGVSTESNLPDFRSVDGLYHTKYAYDPEQILSHTFFINHTEEFYKFYKDKMVYLDAKPNPAHYALAKLEQIKKLKAIVTQNIDGLHQDAGSRHVLELHGSVHRNYCMQCHKFYDAQYVVKSKGVPHCSCGGVIKPDVVLYEESLDSKILEQSIDVIEKADVLIVGGTSLMVYPASGLINYYHGNKLVLINKSVTSADRYADLVIHDNIGQTLGEILKIF